MKFTTKQLSYEDILQYVSEEDIALYYLGVTSKSKMFSFYREETNPGYYLYYKNGRVMYYDCVESRTLSRLIMEVNGWSFKDFMDNLKQDFNTRLVTPSKIKKLPKIESKPKHTEIKIKTRDWNQEDANFWMQGNISLDVLSDPKINIVPISYYWINGWLNVAAELSYCFNYYWETPDLFLRKIYQPYNERKWISNITKNVVQGWKNLPKNGELLIVTSSLKDSLTIQCNLNIPSISPNSELAFLPEKIIPKLNARFKKIIVLFDSDESGIRGAKKYKEKYGWDYIYINSKWSKDPFEFVSKYGTKAFKEYFQFLINQ